MTTRRKFLTHGALAAGTTALAAPAIAQGAPLKWRMQTYAGAALGEHVCKPAVEAFNKIANGQMEIELFYADQLVPTAELFRAMQNGTIDAVQSDDDSMASPTEVTVFGGYFPFALRYSLDVPALFNHYGLDEIWKEQYAAQGIQHISAGSWDPCNFATKQPINSLADLKGKRVVLNIFPSLDTGVCATSVRKFNKLASSLPDTVVVAVSKDLPFAQSRFCTTEGIANVVPASDFRAAGFAGAYGVLMADGPLAGLLARAVVVIDKAGKVVYTELVPEITEEPDYDAAVEAVKAF